MAVFLETRIELELPFHAREFLEKYGALSADSSSVSSETASEVEDNFPGSDISREDDANPDALTRIGISNIPDGSPSVPESFSDDNLLSKALSRRNLCQKIWRFYKYEDGTKKAIPLRCNTPICPDCIRVNFWKVVNPRFEEMLRLERILKRRGRKVKHVVLTLPEESPEVQARKLVQGWEKLLDMRIGPRAWRAIKRETFRRIEGAYTTEGGKDSGAINRHKWMVRKFENRLGEFWRRESNLKVRDIFLGFRNLHPGFKNGFHVHLHVVLFMFTPISRFLLETLWKRATGQKAYVYIKEHGDLRKLLSYLSTYPIPKSKERQVALLKAFKDIKRVSFFGKWKARNQSQSESSGRVVEVFEARYCGALGNKRLFYFVDDEFDEQVIYAVFPDGSWSFEASQWHPRWSIPPDV